jgi:hypothetical protein
MADSHSPFAAVRRVTFATLITIRFEQHRRTVFQRANRAAL